MAERAFLRLRKPEERDRAHFSLRDPERDPRIPTAQLQAEQASMDRALRAPEAGDPLAPALRLDLEEKFGRDLGHIRVHSGKETREATAGANALALTRGAHIYIASPAVAREPQVMAHEVAHSVQHGAAPPLRFASPERAGQGRGARSHARVGRAPASAAAGRASRAQKWDFDVWGAARSVGDTVSSGIDTAVGAVADFGSDLLASGRDAVMNAIRTHLPEFLPMFEGDGIGSFLRRLIENGLRSLFDGLTAPLRGLIDVDALSQNFQGAMDRARTIAAQLANNDCSGIMDAARDIGQIFNETLSPVFTSVREASSKVEGFFRGLGESIAAPIMDLLRNIGGDIWSSLQDFVGDLGRLIGRAREALGSAWQTVRGWLGIRAEEGTSEGGGLWNWVRDKATDIGNSISNVIRPALGPMRQAAGTMLLVIPGGQILGIIALWPQIRQGFDWVTRTWNDLNLIPRAREEIVNNILPSMRANAEAFGQALIAGADWLLARFDEFNGFLAEVASAAVGILTPLRNLITAARDITHRLIAWAREKLQQLSRDLHSLIDRFLEFMAKVGDALRDLIAAIVNPFGIIGFLAGSIWLALPECLKGPIIDFLLEVVEDFIEALPTNPLLGILWPVVRAALLGFVRRVRSVELEEKIRLADKMARIISGQSFDFAIGYLRGIVLGVWEAIIAPFQALAMVFELPDRIQRFLENLGVSFCEVIEQIRCFIANLASSAFGRLDGLLGTLQEYLSDPAKIVDLISCAIDGLLSAAESLGRQIADGVLGIFRSSEDAIGEQLGRITGSIIAQAVLTYFTAGIAAGVGIAGRIAQMLGSVGRALQPVIRMITQLFGRMMRFVRGLMARIGRAIVSGARSVMMRMGAFFRRVFGWFGRLFRRIFRWFRRRFMLTPTQRLRWGEFRLAMTGLHNAHSLGAARRVVSREFRRIVRQFRDVARFPSFITKHGPNWRLRVRRVKSVRPRIVTTVKMDPATRLRAATREAKSEIRSYKRLRGSIGNDDIQRILARVRREYDITSFTSHYNPREQAFDIRGSINPIITWKTRPPRPPRNVVASDVAHRSIRLHPLVERNVYSPPFAGNWTPWTEVGEIRARPSGTSSLYVRGHIAHGRFSSGRHSNLMPITRAANGLMRTQVEGPVIRALGRNLSTRPVYDYVVTTGAPTTGALITRRFPGGGPNQCRTVPQEGHLVSSITMRATPFTYNPTSQQWNQPHPSLTPETAQIDNVPPHVTGWREPCP